MSLSAADRYRAQAYGCRLGASPSHFYADLLDALADDADRGGPADRVLASVAELPFEAMTPLRLFSGVHRMVLGGELPDLAARFPSTGGDGDAAAAVAALLAVLAEPTEVILDALTRDPQTNEVGRSAALATGLAVVGAEARLPIRLFEIGASAGLNLRIDRYWFDAGSGAVWGDPESVVRFGPDDYEGQPRFSAHTTIAERRGCDLDPIDASTENGALALQSYVWPDRPERLDRLRGALAVAARTRVEIDAASADEWVDDQVRPEAGSATVLMHSIMWQYLPDAARDRITATMAARGSIATADAPLAWLRFEPAPDLTHPETRLRCWRGDADAGSDRLLATSTFHGPPVRMITASLIIGS